MKRFEPRLADGPVALHIGADLKIQPTFEEGYFDTTYTYEQAVKALVVLAQSLVKPGGFICGDD